jgi:2-dehydropantoate 2-reductase
MARMRIVVMGAGGTGGYFGAKLARAGHDVTFVARGRHLERIRADGLRVRSAVEGEWVVKAAAVDTLEGQPPAELVLFCVKSFDTETAAAVVKPVIGPGTAVLSIQNGVDNEEKLIPILGAGHVVGGMAQVFATIEEPGVIRHVQLGRIVFGEMDGRETPRVRAILQACEDAGIPAAITPDVTKTLWEKYVFLTAQAGMTAVTRCPVGPLRDDTDLLAMWQAALLETIAVARTKGVDLPRSLLDDLVSLLNQLPPQAQSSMLGDLERRRPLELPWLSGAVVRMGDALGVKTPVHRFITTVLRPHVNGRA